MDAREIIAKRVAKEFSDGDFINLGIGVPTLVADYIPEWLSVTLHSENGFIGLSETPAAGEEDKDLTNAGAKPVTIDKSGAFFDLASSFGIIRGGHIDLTVLGALQVDQHKNIANWKIPNKMTPGMGGAMDLLVGTKRVIVAMEHTAKGESKILKECELPLTAKGVVDMIVTEMAVFEFQDDKMILKEYAPNVTIDEIKVATKAEYLISPNLKMMEL